MSLYDRDYSRGTGDGGGSDLGGRILRWLNYSFSIGTYFNIRVSVHISFVVLFALYLIFQGDPAWTVRWMTLLFLSVLLHEFGHCLACRSVGGSADDILMWPLGGLAMCSPPRRPWPEFVTVIWGPMVNVIIAIATFAMLAIWYGAENPMSFHPMRFWGEFRHPGVGGLIEDLFAVNYALLLFNLLLVFYPFDGGRLVQIAIWTRLGYQRSLFIATAIGMVGAVLVGLYGLAVGEFLLVFIGVFGFYTCYQQRAYLKMEAAEYGPSFDIGYEQDSPRSRPGPIARWREKRRAIRANEKARKQREFEQEIDRILAKVHEQGLQSLSRKEKRTLQHATEKQRGG